MPFQYITTERVETSKEVTKIPCTINALKSQLIIQDTTADHSCVNGSGFVFMQTRCMSDFGHGVGWSKCWKYSRRCLSPLLRATINEKKKNPRTNPVPLLVLKH